MLGAGVYIDEKGCIEDTFNDPAFHHLQGRPWRTIEKTTKVAGAGITVTTNGWMDGVSMLKWIEALPQVREGSNAWLCIAVYSAHRTEDVIRAARDRGYTMLYVPPGIRRSFSSTTST
jgi:hypothetical protein